MFSVLSVCSRGGGASHDALGQYPPRIPGRTSQEEGPAPTPGIKRNMDGGGAAGGMVPNWKFSCYVDDDVIKKWV